MQLDTYVVIQYIKSSVDIILNLKFEEIEKRLMDKQDEGKKKEESQRSVHSNVEKKNEEVSSSQRSSQSGVEGPPKVYEEVIQGLEANIRKHIRVSMKNVGLI
jgi:hypothetical protein